MGLINAATGAVSQVIGDQFKEYVTCPVSDRNVLVARGTVNHGSGNSNPTEGIISNGSKIVVPQGFAMMIVDNGAIKEFSAEPGEYIWDTSSEPSVFEGGFVKGITDSIKRIGDRITYGGQPAKDQRVYYINLLTITENKFGSPNPETVFDPVYGSVEITFNGMYSFKVVDPTVLVANLIGANAKDVITVEDVVSGQLKMTFISNVSVCISKLMTESQPQISFNMVQAKKNEICSVMNDLLDESWKNQYGLEIQDVTIVINASEESKKIIREMDADVAKTTRMANVYSQNMTGAMAAATGEAMKTAAGNENGAMMGVMGMNMASTVGGNAMATAQNIPDEPAPAKEEAKPYDLASAMGMTNNQNPTPSAAKFCTNCGAPVNGKFCSQCGTQIQ